eukprot:365455-Chlamydomonas_euryale.AAC.31
MCVSQVRWWGLQTSGGGAAKGLAAGGVVLSSTRVGGANPPRPCIAGVCAPARSLASVCAPARVCACVSLCPCTCGGVVLPGIGGRALSRDPAVVGQVLRRSLSLGAQL